MDEQSAPTPELQDASVGLGRAARRRAAEEAEQAEQARRAIEEPPARGSEAPSPSAMSRTERRRLEHAEAAAARSQHALWKAWWLYALIAAVGVAVFLGVRSASEAPPPQPVVTTVPDR